MCYNRKITPFFGISMSYSEKFKNHLNLFKYRYDTEQQITKGFSFFFKTVVAIVFFFTIVGQFLALTALTLRNETYSSFRHGFLAELQSIDNYKFIFVVLFLVFMLHMLVIFTKNNMIKELKLNALTSLHCKERLNYLSSIYPELNEIIQKRVKSLGYFSMMDYKFLQVDRYYPLIKSERSK